jgi:hypothetical protein
MLDYYAIPEIDVFNYLVEDLQRIADWELVEIKSEIYIIMCDESTDFSLRHARARINQYLYYCALDWFTKTEEERNVHYVNSTTLKYSTPYLQVTEK